MKDYRPVSWLKLRSLFFCICFVLGITLRTSHWPGRHWRWVISLPYFSVLKSWVYHIWLPATSIPFVQSVSFLSSRVCMCLLLFLGQMTKNAHTSSSSFNRLWSGQESGHPRHGLKYVVKYFLLQKGNRPRLIQNQCLWCFLLSVLKHGRKNSILKLLLIKWDWPIKSHVWFQDCSLYSNPCDCLWALSSYLWP